MYNMHMDQTKIKQLKIGKINLAYSGKSLGNLGPAFGDNAQENQKEFFASTPKNSKIFMINPDQNSIVNVDEISESKSPIWVDCEALITREKNTVLSLFPADCLPLVLYSENTNLLVLLHISTFNAKNSLIERTMDLLGEKFKIEVDQLKCYIGPSIKKESYVHENLEDKQISEKLTKFIQQKTDGWHIDLLGYTISILEDRGFTKDRITIEDIDTGSNADYFSHRRSALTDEPEGRNGLLVYF